MTTQKSKTAPYLISNLTGEFVRVLEVWESFNGFYWYVTERADPKDPNYCFGLVDMFEKEWGYFDLNDLRASNKVWKVKACDVSVSKNIVMRAV